MIRMSEMLDKLNDLTAEMAFLIKAVKAMDSMPEDPITDEETRGLQLFFNMICKHMEELPIQIQQAFGSETREKVWVNLVKN